MGSGSLPKRPQTERPFLSPAEVEALACAMTHERDRVLVRQLAYGGLRVGEALALRWSDVDLPPWNAHGPPECGGFDRASDYWADQDLRNENHHPADRAGR